MCLVPKRCNDMMNLGRLQGFEVSPLECFQASLSWTAGAWAVRRLPFEALCLPPLPPPLTICAFVPGPSGSRAQEVYLFRICSDKAARESYRAVRKAGVTIPRGLERRKVPCNCGPGSDLFPFSCLRSECWESEGAWDYGTMGTLEGKWNTSFFL